MFPDNLQLMLVLGTINKTCNLYTVNTVEDIKLMNRIGKK